MRPREILSPKFSVPQLKEGQNGVFRAIIKNQAYSKSKTTGRPKKLIPDFRIPATCTVMDEGRPKQIGNVVRETNVKRSDGTPGIDYVTEDIFSKLGVVSCGYREQAKFEYLMCSNYNASNPFRDTRVEPVYYFDDASARQGVQYNVDSLTHQAKGIVYKFDKDQLKPVAKKLNVNPDQPITALRQSILSRIDTMNQGGKTDGTLALIRAFYMNDTDTQTLKASADIVEAKEKGYIALSPMSGDWILTSNTPLLITNVSSEEDPLTELRQYIMSNSGKKYHTALKDMNEDKITATEAYERLVGQLEEEERLAQEEKDRVEQEKLQKEEAERLEKIKAEAKAEALKQLQEESKAKQAEQAKEAVEEKVEEAPEEKKGKKLNLKK